MEEMILRAAEGKADVSHLALRYLGRPDFGRMDTQHCPVNLIPPMLITKCLFLYIHFPGFCTG